MEIAKPRLSLVFALALAGQLGLAARQEDPYHLVAMAFDRKSPVNVEAVVRVLGPHGHKETVKLLADKQGRQRMTVLLPIDEGGMEVLLLGDTTEVYEPDKNRLHITPTVAISSLTRSKRESLLRKNYVLTERTGYYVAGHSAVRITAKPKHSGQGVSEFYIDPTAHVVLRFEQSNGSGTERTLYEAVHVEYRSSFPSDAFELRPKDGVTVMEESVPTEVTSASQAKRLLGAKPLIPRSLPLGFEVTRMYYSEQKGHSEDDDDEETTLRALDLEINDGIVTATIHEFERDKVPDHILEALEHQHQPFVVIGKLLVAIRGHISEDTGRQILNALNKHRGNRHLP